MPDLFFYAGCIWYVLPVLWLLYRLLQVIRIPVKDLIEILKVEVPPAPEVSLAQIQSNSATVEWTRPNRPVQKYIIEVNGKTVGSQGPQDSPAISVTGLKPGFFYNIRVIAVGSNNFQVGSPVLRLRTLGADARPQLGNGRLPTSLSDALSPRHGDDDGDTASDASKGVVPSIESAKSIDGTTGRDTAGLSAVTHRRGVGRRHSPSVASMDAPVVKEKDKEVPSSETQESLAKLNEVFQQIRANIADTISQYEKDEADFKRDEVNYQLEAESKRKELKQKKKASDAIKTELSATESQYRKMQKEEKQARQQLEAKMAERATSERRIAKYEEQMESWTKRRAELEKEAEKMEMERDEKVDALEQEIEAIRTDSTRLETVLEEKRQKTKELKDERKKLPGGEADEQWEQTDKQLEKEWAERKRELDRRLANEAQRQKILQERLHSLQVTEMQLTQYLQHNMSASNGMDNATSQQHLRQPGHQSSPASMWGPGATYAGSPEAMYGTVASNAVSGMGFGSPRPFMKVPVSLGESSDMSHIPNSAAPLSPSATSLVPRGILMDDLDAPPSPSSGPSPYRPVHGTDDAQSPTSSSQSLSLMSSPRSSSQHLPHPSHYSGEGADQRSRDLGIGSSPTAPTSIQPSRFGFDTILSGFHKSRGGFSKEGDDHGPLLGTLKPGQSQSFPRQTDDGEGPGGRRRMIPNIFNRNSVHADTGDVRGITSSSRTRRLNPFASSTPGIPGIPGIGDRDPSSPRPSSLASSDLARPSTDSGRMWATPGEGGGLGQRHVWQNPMPSRTHSRRASLHGQSAAPATTLASTDDEILDEEDLQQASPSQVGIIGSRMPVSARPTLSQRLNPKAREFKVPGFLGSRRKQDKDVKDKSSSDAKTVKARDGGKAAKGNGIKVKTPTASLFGSATPGATEASQQPPLPTGDDSPSDSRKSRDTFSVHTQTSVSESRDSLNLDHTPSYTASDSNTGGGGGGGGGFGSVGTGSPSLAAGSSAANLKEQEAGALKKLFRKGSSSRFSLSSRLKKGPGSTTNSDKNFSADRSSVGDVDDIGDELHRATMSASSAAVAVAGTGSGASQQQQQLQLFSSSINSNMSGGNAGGGGGGGGGASVATMSTGYDSVTSSPLLGPSNINSKVKDKEGRMSGWRFSKKKKAGRDPKESLELDRERNTTQDSEN